MRHARTQAGFTLFEMIVVVIILGLLGGVVLSRAPRSARLEADMAVRGLTDALRLARSRAIVQDRAVAVVVGERGFVVDGEKPRILPPGESLTPLRVVFMADGGSTGGVTRLTAGERQIAVSISWLTGAVQVKN